MGLRDLRQANEWVADKADLLRSIKLVVLLSLGLVLVTPMVVTQLVHSYALVATLVCWAFEAWSLVAIARRARRAEVHLPDSPSANDARIALASAYVVVPIAVMCARSWYGEHKYLWVAGASILAVTLLGWPVKVLLETRVPPR